jgi:hypothetical protein
LCHDCHQKSQFFVTPYRLKRVLLMPIEGFKWVVSLVSHLYNKYYYIRESHNKESLRVLIRVRRA